MSLLDITESSFVEPRGVVAFFNRLGSDMMVSFVGMGSSNKELEIGVVDNSVALESKYSYKLKYRCTMS